MDWLRIKLYNYYFYFLYLGYHDLLGSRVLQVSQIDWVDWKLNILSFFINFFFQFHSSTLVWLEIELYNFFLFSFYRVYLGLLTRIDSSYFFYRFLFFFFNFIFPYWVDWLVIKIHNFSHLLYMDCYDLMTQLPG
jgi:hypothetical protein